MEKDTHQVVLGYDFVVIGTMNIPLVVFWDQDMQTAQTVAPEEYEQELTEQGYDEQIFGYIPLSVIETRDEAVIWNELYANWGKEGIVAPPHVCA